MFGLKWFALLLSTDRKYLKVVFFQGVKVSDDQLCVLLRNLNLLLLSICSRVREEQTTFDYRKEANHSVGLSVAGLTKERAESLFLFSYCVFMFEHLK